MSDFENVDEVDFEAFFADLDARWALAEAYLLGLGVDVEEQSKCAAANVDAWREHDPSIFDGDDTVLIDEV